MPAASNESGRIKEREREKEVGSRWGEGRDYWVHRHAKPKSYIETKNFCRILHMKMPQLLFFFFFSSRFSSFCFLPLFSTLEISDSSKAGPLKRIYFPVAPPDRPFFFH
jgi:hypothetical protein